jgi:predicted Holliday junction resolvase-like endonuclease
MGVRKRIREEEEQECTATVQQVMETGSEIIYHFPHTAYQPRQNKFITSTKVSVRTVVHTGMASACIHRGPCTRQHVWQ